MACADIDMDIHQAELKPHRAGRKKPTLARYQATELMPDKEGPLHDLLKKQPAVLGSLQVMAGLFSVGVGIVFAVTHDPRQSLFTLFRVSLLTGILFIFAGVISNLLVKYPLLLSVSFKANCSCIIVAAVAASLISVDMSRWNTANEQYLKMEILVLFVLGFEVFLSVVLCIWFFKEKRSKSP